MRLIEDQYLNTAETLRIRTEQDGDAQNPRKEMEPLSHFVAKHPRYDLGDKEAMSDLADALSAIVPDGIDINEDMIDCPTCQDHDQVENLHYVDTSDGPSLYQGLAKLDPDEIQIFRLPVFMIDHSGIALSTKPFGCPWDSGQVGFIWMTRQEAEEVGGNDGSVESLRDAAHRCMKSEIETYSQYVEGQVYGFICERYVGPEGDDKDTDDEINWEEEDSCWGFFGMDLIENGMLCHWEERYVTAFCEAEGITREQLDAEKEAYRQKVTGEIASAE